MRVVVSKWNGGVGAEAGEGSSGEQGKWCVRIAEMDTSTPD